MRLRLSVSRASRLAAMPPQRRRSLTEAGEKLFRRGRAVAAHRVGTAARGHANWWDKLFPALYLTKRNYHSASTVAYQLALFGVGVLCGVAAFWKLSCPDTPLACAAKYGILSPLLLRIRRQMKSLNFMSENIMTAPNARRTGSFYDRISDLYSLTFKFNGYGIILLQYSESPSQS